jgi:hypothetical protein
MTTEYIHDSELPVELCDDALCRDHHDTDRARIIAGVHRWFCGTVNHESQRSAVPYACERGADVVIAELNR